MMAGVVPAESVAAPPSFSLHRGLDTLVARVAARERLFEDGWGDTSFLDRIRRGEVRFEGADACRVAWGRPRTKRDLELTDGTFPSPRPFAFPASVSLARVRRVKPRGIRSERAVVVIAGSREEGFFLRHWIWDALVRRGITAYFLENPCFGARRLPGHTSAVPTVSAHLQMNLASVAEASALLRALDRFASRAVAGFSMGGYMAGLTAAVTPLPLAVAVLAGGITPVEVFTSTVFSSAVAFDVLQRACPLGVDARTAFAALFAENTVVGLPLPQRPDAVVIVGGDADAFVPASHPVALSRHWPGAKLEIIHAGHVSAVLLHRAALRSALLQAFAALER